MSVPVEGSSELEAAYQEFCRTANPEERAGVERILEHAHQEATEVLAGTRSSVQHAALAMAWSKLVPDAQPLQPGMQDEFALPARVDGKGLIWGIGKYTQLDPRWNEALIRFFKYRSDKARFGDTPQTIKILNQTTLALAGDWGTNGAAEEKVADEISKAKPDHTLHLGDVYYAGSEAEEQRFVESWPRGTVGSFTLNSNHEMYSGGHPYFEIALAENGPFAAQRGTSYFALVNDYWVLVGLDASYYSSPSNLYMDGTIDSSQREFLQSLRASFANQRIIIVSHNEGFDLKGEQTNGLWAQVKGALGRVPDYWYWGHAHNVVVYKPYDNCRARCIGHGAVPYGVASDLESAPAVEWYEKGTANDDKIPKRVLNGFLHLTLDGPLLKEKLIGEDGSTRWSS